MSFRDPEDLVLNTLRNVMCTATGIPSGQIHIKRPSIEFVSKNEDTSQSTQFKPLYPAISINYMKDAKVNYNNYGGSKFARNGDGTITEYQALAEYELLLAVSLFTQSRKDQRDYGIKLEQLFLTNKYMVLQGDTIQNEYFSLEYRSKRDVPTTDPFHKAYVIACCVRFLAEVTGYEVTGVITNTSTVDMSNGATVGDLTVTVADNDTNSLLIDTSDEFNAGTFIETQST